MASLPLWGHCPPTARIDCQLTPLPAPFPAAARLATLGTSLEAERTGRAADTQAAEERAAKLAGADERAVPSWLRSFRYGSPVVPLCQWLCAIIALMRRLSASQKFGILPRTRSELLCAPPAADHLAALMDQAAEENERREGEHRAAGLESQQAEEHRVTQVAQVRHWLPCSCCVAPRCVVVHNMLVAVQDGAGAE